MPPRIIQIQFVGGPYDGHVQPFNDPGLIERLALPVHESVLLLLKGKKLGLPSAINSIARYQLQRTGDAWQYHFVELVSAKDIDFEAMREAGRKVIAEHKRTKRKKK